LLTVKGKAQDFIKVGLRWRRGSGRYLSALNGLMQDGAKCTGALRLFLVSTPVYLNLLDNADWRRGKYQ
jgi:hypothetical protein